MGYKRKPVYHMTDTDTGINKIPLDRVIIHNSKIYTKQNNNSLDATSTIIDAILSEAVIETTGASGTGGEIIFINANTVLETSKTYICNTEGIMLGLDEINYTLTLPIDGSDKDSIFIIDRSGNAQDRPILIKTVQNTDGTTSTMDGTLDDITLDVNYFDVTLVFNEDANNWSVGG